MWERYGKLIGAFALGALIVWGLNGFKNPLKGMMASTNLPKEGDVCTIAGTTQKGTIQGGVCKA